MSKKERSNLETCLDGNLRSICKYFWLAPQQAQRVREAERREGN